MLLPLHFGKCNCSVAVAAVKPRDYFKLDFGDKKINGYPYWHPPSRSRWNLIHEACKNHGVQDNIKYLPSFNVRT